MPHTTKRQKTNNFHEASILHALDHPNVVKYLTCHEIKDDLWLVMEFLEGGTFEEAARAWKFNEANLAYVAREVGFDLLVLLVWCHKGKVKGN